MKLLSLYNINLLLENPVLIFALILLIILNAPVFFKKIHIPEVVGLLICGALIGLYGFNFISPELEFSIIGTTGILYLMFLTGLEINLKDFALKKKRVFSSEYFHSCCHLF